MKSRKSMKYINKTKEIKEINEINFTLPWAIQFGEDPIGTVGTYIRPPSEDDNPVRATCPLWAPVCIPFGGK